jgi:hypothetical protein
MLIASKEADYYDVGSRYGVDKTVVYIRDRKEYLIKDKNLEMPHKEEVYWKGKDVTYHVYKHIIGFCGKLYPTIEFRLVISGGYRSQFFYDLESVEKFLQSRKITIKNERIYSWTRKDYSISTTTGIKNFFEATDFSQFTKSFQIYKTPIFIVSLAEESNRKTILTTNPILRLFLFYKIKDPITAYQDIFMYISGVLGTSHMDMPEFSDKLKAKAKGHDGKYSFRKPPGTKRGKPKWR